MRKFVATMLALLGAGGALAQPYSGIYFFGDSLTDTGNVTTVYASIPHPPGAPAAVPGPPYDPQGRASNGPLYADVLAAGLGFSALASARGGSNYAFGGARTDYNRVEFRPTVPPPLPNGVYPIAAYPWSLDLQREAFLDDATRHADPKGLYVVFTGSNDLSDALTALVFLHQDPTPTIAKAVQGIKNAITAFETAGAQTVLVLSIPNLGVVPSVTRFGPTVSGIATALSQQFNAALAAMLTPIPTVPSALSPTSMHSGISSIRRLAFTRFSQTNYMRRSFIAKERKKTTRIRRPGARCRAAQ